MNLTMLAAPAAVRLGVAAAEGTARHVVDFAGHLARAIGGDESSPATASSLAASQSGDAAPAEADSERFQALKEFLGSIGVQWQESIEWDGQADRIAKINSDRLEPWQATSLRRWLDDRPDVKPVGEQSPYSAAAPVYSVRP